MTPRPDLEAIEARLKAATIGPWTRDVEDVYSDSADLANIVCSRPGDEYPASDSRWDANSEFLANARQDIPALLAYIRHLEAAGSAQAVDPGSLRRSLVALADEMDARSERAKAWVFPNSEQFTLWANFLRALAAPPSPAPAALRWAMSRGDIQSYTGDGEPVCFLYPPDPKADRIPIQGANCRKVAKQLLAALNGQEPEGTPSETPAAKVLSLQDHKDKKALPIILENIQHLTEPGTPSEKGAV